MKRTIFRTLALASLACSPAWAQTTGLASVTGLSFELIDLALDDGIDPTLTWQSAATSADVLSMAGTVLSIAPDGTWTTSFSSSNTNAFSNPLSLLAAGGANLSATSAGIQGAALQALFGTAADGSFESAIAFTNGSFQLSQMTELRVTGRLSAGVSGASGASFTVPAGTPADFAAVHSFASAFAAVSLSPVSGGGASTVSSFEFVTVDGANHTPSNQAGLPVAAYQAASLLVPFSVSLINDSSLGMDGEFFAQAATSGQQIVSPPATSPVPEVATWAALLTGMVMFSALRLRREPWRH